MIKVALVLIRDGQRKDFPLTGKSTTVGRAIDCTLRVPTGDVSRKHCEILVGDRDVTVKDLGSANGTYVNGKRVAESKVAAGDRIQVGPATFVVQINGKPENVALPSGAPAEPVRPATAKPAAAPGPSAQAGQAKPSTPAAKPPTPGVKPATPKPAPGKPAQEEKIFELDESDFDLDDALAELDALDVDDDLDSGERPKPGKK
ncbi:MAG: FHA domain-containing protein [Phycisphaerae bacterium]